MSLSDQDQVDDRNSSDAALTAGDLLSIDIWVYAGSSIMAVGTAGHLVAACAVLSSRTLRSLPVSVYMLGMFASGTASLYVGLLNRVIWHATRYETDVRSATSSEAGCDVHAVLTYLSLQYYAWMQATAAVERLVSATWPVTYRKRITTRFNSCVAAAELLALVALNGVVAAAYGYDSDDGCVAVDKWLWHGVWGYLDLCLYMLLPAAVLLPCDALILKRLHDRRRLVHNARRRALPITVTLLAINAIFVVSTLPVSLIFLVAWPDQSSPEYDTYVMLWTVFNLFQYAGSSVSSFAYFVLGSKFRKSLAGPMKRLLTSIRFSSSFSTTTTTTARMSKRPTITSQAPSEC